MRRLGPMLLGVGSVVLVVGLTTSPDTGVMAPLLGATLTGAALWLITSSIRRRRPAPRGAWTPASAVAFRPATGHARASAGGVALALGRVESRELASSTSFGVGIGFCAMTLLLFGRVWAGDYGGDLASYTEMLPILTHPLAGLLVLGAHRARTRSTRDGAQELFDSCPTTEGTRTAGHLLTAGVGAAAGLAFVGILTAMVVQASTTTYGEVGGRQVAALLGSVLLAVGAVALGVALARWAPWTLVPVAAVVAIGFGSVRLAVAGDRTTEPIRQLSTWLNDPILPVQLTAPHWAAHHLWILALVAVVALLALVHDAPRPSLLAATAVASLVAATAAIAATRPITTADAQRIAALVSDPAAQQRCVDAAGLPVCAYPGDDALTDHLAAELAPVVAAAPPGSLDGWLVRHGADIDRDELDPEVRRRLATREEGGAHAGSEESRPIPMLTMGHRLADQGARFWVALTAVGVADETTDGITTNLWRQARGVVALWLATRGADEETVAAMTSFHERVRQGREYARPWPDPCFAGPTPVSWALSDLDAARALHALPEDEVRRLLTAEWERFTDPDTTTAELLAAAGTTLDTRREGVTRDAQEC